MKRKKDIFSSLENADDKLVEELSQNYEAITDEKKTSILERSEQKLKQMKLSQAAENRIDSSTVMLSEIQHENKQIWKIAACIVCLIIAGTAVVFTLNTVKPNDPVTPQANIEIQESTPDLPHKENISSTQKDVVSDTNETRNIKSEQTTDTSKNENTEEDKKAEESINTEETSDSDYIVFDTDYDEGYTGVERIMAVTDDMTYGEVIELLGNPNTVLIQEGFAQFRIKSDEGEKVLFLFYDNSDDVIAKDGHQLYDETIPMESLYCDTENFTFEGIVADIHDGGSIRISCPQYPIFDCADFHCNDDEVLQNIKLGSRIKVTHQDEVLSVYPPIINVESVEIED